MVSSPCGKGHLDFSWRPPQLRSVSLQPSVARIGRSPVRTLAVSGMRWSPTSVGCLKLPVPSYGVTTVFLSARVRTEPLLHN